MEVCRTIHSYSLCVVAGRLDPFVPTPGLSNLSIGDTKKGISLKYENVFRCLDLHLMHHIFSSFTLQL